MKCDGYCSDTVVAAARRRRPRRRRQTCQSFTCVSPWFILCRWFHGGKSSGSTNTSMERQWEEEKKNMDGSVKHNNLIAKKGSTDHEESSSSSSRSENGKEASSSFNLGVGFGMIHLVAASRNELNKMVELHKRIELLLQNLQTEFRNKQKANPLLMPTKSSISSSSFSNTAVQETPCSHGHESGQCSSPSNVRRAEIVLGSDRYIRGEKSLRMDKLEAEFDNLNLQMDEELPSKHSKQQCSEINVEDSAPEWSVNTCLEETTEQEEYIDDVYYGVPPIELERKLHELLETRQQDRINELESAVDYFMEQLEEKERELEWWKDTARLISQHLPAIPALLRQVKKQAMEPQFEVRDSMCSVRIRGR